MCKFMSSCVYDNCNRILKNEIVFQEMLFRFLKKFLYEIQICQILPFRAILDGKIDTAKFFLDTFIRT